MIKKTTADPTHIRSLIHMSLERVHFLKSADQDHPNFIFEGLYTSIVELLHALAMKSGIKIDNHICLAYYLGEMIGRKDLFRTFNDLRYKRNSLVYYGKIMKEEAAEQSVAKARALLAEIGKLIESSRQSI